MLELCIFGGSGAVFRLRLIDWMRLRTPCAVDVVAQVDEGDHHHIQLEALSEPSRDCEWNGDSVMICD